MSRFHWLRSILQKLGSNRTAPRVPARYRPTLEALESRDLMTTGMPVVQWYTGPIQMPGEAFRAGDTLWLRDNIDLADAPSYQSAVSWGLRLSLDSTVDASDKLVYSNTKYGVTAVGNLYTDFSLPGGGDAFWEAAKLADGQRTFWLGFYVKNETTGVTTWYGTESIDVKPSITATFDSVTHVLSVNGTKAADTIKVRQQDGLLSVDGVKIFYIRQNKSKDNVSAVRVTSIEARGGADADTIVLSQQITVGSKLYGGGGDDTIRGGSGDDVIYGGKGGNKPLGWFVSDNDKLFGRGGKDELYGESGSDWLEAGSIEEKADFGPAGSEDYNAHKWIYDGITMQDVKQAQASQCSFLAALASCARTRNIDLRGRIHYLGNFEYTVGLFDNGFLFDEIVKFDGTLTAADPIPSKQGEFWTILYQRAYLQLTGNEADQGSQLDVALSALTNRGANIDYWLDDTTYEDMKAALAFNSNVVCGSWPGGDLPGNHAYTVIAVWSDAQTGGRYVQLRNPWGNDKPFGDLITLSWEDFSWAMKTVVIEDAPF